MTKTETKIHCIHQHLKFTNDDTTFTPGTEKDKYQHFTQIQKSTPQAVYSHEGTSKKVKLNIFQTSFKDIKRRKSSRTSSYYSFSISVNWLQPVVAPLMFIEVNGYGGCIICFIRMTALNVKSNTRQVLNVPKRIPTKTNTVY